MPHNPRIQYNHYLNTVRLDSIKLYNATLRKKYGVLRRQCSYLRQKVDRPVLPRSGERSYVNVALSS